MVGDKSEDDGRDKRSINSIYCSRISPINRPVHLIHRKVCVPRYISMYDLDLIIEPKRLVLHNILLYKGTSGPLMRPVPGAFFFRGIPIGNGT